MPDQSHSPEPWRFRYERTPDDEGLCRLFSVGNDEILTGEHCDLDNLRRVVACVNFLRGVPTDELERFIVAGGRVRIREGHIIKSFLTAEETAGETIEFPPDGPEVEVT